MSAIRDCDLAEHLTGADTLLRRRALSKAITLVESSRMDQRQRGDALLDELFPKTGGSFRIGITGPPGSGKSTLVNAIGLMLIEQGHRVAVLCVDPSSNLSDGCVLADKTRCTALPVVRMHTSGPAQVLQVTAASRSKQERRFGYAKRQPTIS